MTLEAPPPIRILFVFAWLVVGGEETEVRLLARHLDRERYRIDVLACFRKEGMPDQTHDQLAALGVHVDTTAYALVLRGHRRLPRPPPARLRPRRLLPERRRHLPRARAPRAPPAADRAWRPRLRGPRRSQALHRPLRRRLRQHPRRRRRPDAGPVAITRVEIPSMVDPAEFDPAAPRAPARRSRRRPARCRSSAGSAASTARSASRTFFDAAALVRAAEPATRFVVIGGPDAFMPEYADELRARAAALGLDGALRFLGDRRRRPPTSSPRSMSSSGSRAARACPTSSPRPAWPASPSSPRPTTARCSRSSTA